MNDIELITRIRARSRPLAPLPTRIPQQTARLEGIRSVVFDIYGTLFLSAAGDIGVGLAIDGDEAFQGALAAVGLPPGGDAARLTRAIKAEHARKRAAGIEYPEVDIVSTWQQVVEEMGLSASRETLRCLALEYELRVNPVWPMPGLEETLAGLRAVGVQLGLISNAQFYTPLLFPAFLDQSLEQLGFAPELCVFSWQEGEGKPSRRLFDRMAGELGRLGIAPDQVLYVGNDLLNDLWPASQVGFHGGLFAGDARSLRLREDDPRCQDVEPDCIFKHLGQILQVID